jgi:hypothetical protein
LRQWKTKLKITSTNEIEEIESLLGDFHLRSRTQSAITSLFERLQSLNVGPIRAFVSGSCSEQNLNEVVQKFFDETRGASSWQDYFTSIISVPK